MPNPHRRSLAIGQVVSLIVAALVVATPATAQFGGLKKKLKGEAAQKGVEKAAGEAGAPTETAANPAAAPAGGGKIVLTPEVVDRYMAALKARAAAKEAGKKGNTPYANYLREKAASDAAKSKCEAVRQAGTQRMVADEKKSARYNALMEKMLAAQSKQDYKQSAILQDSILVMIDPSCAVHEPDRPSNLYDMERAVDDSAEQAALKTAEMTPREFGQTGDDVAAILAGDAPGASPSEKAAVTAKSAELRDLMGLRQAQEEKISKDASQPASAAVADTAPTPPAVQGPPMPKGAAVISDCEVKNIEKHQAEIDALGNRGSAAQQAGNNALMMAIADTINRIRLAGCGKTR